jgi:hypothetical protein
VEYALIECQDKNVFMPIERTCPKWINACKVIELCLPDRLTFVQTHIDHSQIEIEIDSSWVSKIHDNTPEEYRDEIRNRLENINYHLMAIIPVNHLLEQFMFTANTEQTLAQINEAIFMHDCVRANRGFATSMEMIKNELGIKHSPLCFSGLDH